MDGKICQNIKPPTPTHIPSYFLLYVKVFYKQIKILLLKNVHFFILTASKNIKTQRIKFEVGFSYKYCI